MPHVSTINVRFAELDPYAHVNHAVYATYFEVARTEALADAGIPLDEMARKGFQFVVVDLAIRYRGAAEAGDTLTVETEITKVSRASTTWSQRILRGDEVLVTGEIRAGVTDTAGRPTKPPPWLFESLDPLLSPDLRPPQNAKGA